MRQHCLLKCEVDFTVFRSAATRALRWQVAIVEEICKKVGVRAIADAQEIIEALQWSAVHAGKSGDAHGLENHCSRPLLPGRQASLLPTKRSYTTKTHLGHPAHKLSTHAMIDRPIPGA
jgi:hypothetical protein